MLIDLEDYRNRRRQARMRAEPVLATAVCALSATPVGHAPARTTANLQAVPAAAFADPVMPSASELTGLFADATLI